MKRNHKGVEFFLIKIWNYSNDHAFSDIDFKYEILVFANFFFSNHFLKECSLAE